MPDEFIVKKIQHLVESIACNSMQYFMLVSWKTTHSMHGAGTAAPGCCLPSGQSWTAVVSMVSINLGIWFYGVETGDTGDSIESEESH
jgi:hypothetical protein